MRRAFRHSSLPIGFDRISWKRGSIFPEIAESNSLPIGFDRIYDRLCECAIDRFLLRGTIGDGLIFRIDGRSATEAFGSIQQLSSDRREKTDIMSTCKKYCVYLKELSTTTPLTPEEQDLMRTMPEIDAWYETEMNNAKLEGEERRNQAIALNMLRRNFPLGTIAEITGLTVEQLEKLSSSPTE